MAVVAARTATALRSAPHGHVEEEVEGADTGQDEEHDWSEVKGQPAGHEYGEDDPTPVLPESLHASSWSSDGWGGGVARLGRTEARSGWPMCLTTFSAWEAAGILCLAGQ